MSHKLHFNGRELNPYAEPVSVVDLKEGQIYFSVNFIDEELLVPSVEPLVFIGRDLESGSIDKWFFQDAESYRQGIRYNSEDPDPPGTFYCGAEPKHIFDYEHALNLLLLCSLRRGER